MENLYVYLGAINGVVPVTIVRKNIKNVHLKVFRNLEVVVSAPANVPQEWIASFLNDHSKWIDGQITKYKRTSGYNNLTNIKSGSSTQFLGKDVRIYKIESSENHIEVDEKKICIYVYDIHDEECAQKTFNEWWRKTAQEIYEKETKNLFDKIFKKYGIQEPIVVIRKMKTLWGSCTPNKHKITLNEYLLKANLRCIQYVILHELTHLLYPNHSKDFYDFLTIHMPDWIERKKQLDHEVVQGL